MSRAEEVRQERRRKPGATAHLGLKLHVPQELRDDKTYVYRFVNDTASRVQSFKDDDWDPAPMGGASTDARVVGTDGGKPIQSILMRKRRDWYEADQKAKRKPLDEMDEAIRRGTAHSKEADLGGVAYTPGDNTMDRG